MDTTAFEERSRTAPKRPVRQLRGFAVWAAILRRRTRQTTRDEKGLPLPNAGASVPYCARRLLGTRECEQQGAPQIGQD